MNTADHTNFLNILLSCCVVWTLLNLVLNNITPLFQYFFCLYWSVLDVFLLPLLSSISSGWPYSTSAVHLRKTVKTLSTVWFAIRSCLIRKWAKINKSPVFRQRWQTLRCTTHTFTFTSIKTWPVLIRLPFKCSGGSHSLKDKSGSGYLPKQSTAMSTLGCLIRTLSGRRHLFQQETENIKLRPAA